MCLVALAIPAESDAPLVLAANRDERHERPADPAGWWHERPRMLAGRDRLAGGTWLGVSAEGRFAAVLNDARRPRPTDAPSRGELVPAFLEAADGAAWLSALAAARERYAGFHLLAGSPAGVDYVSSTTPSPVALPSGIHVVDNAGRDSATPRSRRAREVLGAPLTGGGPPEALIPGLRDRAAPGGGAGDARPVFIEAAEFGTRCSTALVLDTAGRGPSRLLEHRFGALGVALGYSSFGWPASPAGPS